jgi:putative endonuclease
MASAGFLFILRESWRTSAETTSIFSQLMFRAVHWAARRGLRQEERFSSEAKKPEARHSQGNVCLLVFAEAGLRFRATEYAPRGVKGEIDLVGYNGKTLAFVEARTRTVSEDLPALPELSVTGEKQRLVVRTAQRFLAERHVGECPCRFDVMAIGNRTGQSRVVRMHKDAFSPKI